MTTRLIPLGNGLFRVTRPHGRSALTGRFLTGDIVTRSSNPLRALQRAGYTCQARTPAGYRCTAPAGKVDRATGVVVCTEHLSQTSS